MKVRQVLLAMVIVGIVGGLIALPWIYVRSQSASARSDPNDASAASAGSFRYDGKTFDQWQTSWPKELKTDRQVEVLRAMSAFGKHGLAKEAAGVVIDMVREHCRELGADHLLDEQDAIFSEARTALVHIGPHSSLVLLECLKDTARNVNQFARVIANVDLHPMAVPVLVKLVQGDNADWSTLALQTLANNLQKKTPTAEIETAVLDAVKKGKHARKFLDTLQRVLAADKSPSEPVQARDKSRRSAVVLVRTLGPTAQPLAQVVLEAVEQDLRDSRRRASSTPTRSASEGAPSCDDADLCLMIETLGKIQSDASRTVPLLCSIVGNRLEQQGVRICAVKALTDFGPQAVSATKTLIDALDDPIRCQALEALGKIEAGPQWVVPRLAQAIGREIDEPGKLGLRMTAMDQPTPASCNSADRKEFVKCGLDYLEKIAPQAGDAVPVLVRLYSKVEQVRPQVVAVLEKMGPAGQQEAQRLGNELRGTQAKSLPAPAPIGNVAQVNFPVSADDWGKSNQPSQWSGPASGGVAGAPRAMKTGDINPPLSFEVRPTPAVPSRPNPPPPPFTVSSGQQPFTTNSGGQQPFTTSSGQQPFTTSSGQQSFTTSSGQQPFTTSSGQQPFTTSSGQQPFSAGSAPQPLSTSLAVQALPPPPQRLQNLTNLEPPPEIYSPNSSQRNSVPGSYLPPPNVDPVPRPFIPPPG